MKAKKTATLLNTLSVRLDDATFARLLAGAKCERRQLSEYVRLLIEGADSEHVAQVGKMETAVRL